MENQIKSGIELNTTSSFFFNHITKIQNHLDMKMMVNLSKKLNMILFSSLFIIIVSLSVVLIFMDPMQFVFHTEEDANIPEINNIVPDSFPIRDLISNESLNEIFQIIIGEEASSSELYNQISNDLRQTIEEVTGNTVDILNDSVSSVLNNSVYIGNSHINSEVLSIISNENLTFSVDWVSQSFLVKGIVNVTDNFRSLIIYGNDSLGDAYGVYWLIDQILYGEEFSGDFFEIDKIQIPAVKLRMLDSNSAFLDPNTRVRKSPVEQIDLPTYPYFNVTRMEMAKTEFREFLNYTLKTGYNTLQIEEFGHLVTFDDVIDGQIVENYEIFAEDDPFRIRHEQYQEYYSDFFEEADNLGISTYVYTRIPYLPQPVEDYLGGLNPDNFERIVSLYTNAIDEFFTRFPTVDGLQVITGEVGGSHNVLDYSGATVMTSKDALTIMIDSVLDILGKHNKTMIYRIWSIGIGELGDLHRNTEQYDLLFNQFEDRDNLVISIKFQAGDYFRYLEFNPNIGHGSLPQMVEVSGSLEYSGMSLYPCYVAELFQECLQSLDNPPFAMWSWVTAGAAPKEEGFVGPFIVFLKRGFWSNIDVNVNGFGKLGWNSSIDVNEMTRTWVMRNFGYDPKSTENITKMILMSDEMDYLGTYISDFASLQPAHLGDLPTPVHWIYWDVPQSSSFALSPVYDACKNGRGIEANIQDGFQAVVIADEMLELLSDLTTMNPSLFYHWQLATEYGSKLFSMLADYRECFLYFYDYCDTLSKDSKISYQNALDNLKISKEVYNLAFESGYNEMFPLFDLSQLDRFIFNVENYEGTLLLSRLSFGIVILSILGLFTTIFVLKKSEKEVPHKLVRIKRLLLRPLKYISSTESDQPASLVLPLSFFFVTSILQAVNTVIFNFSNQGWKLFFVFLFGHILALIVFSVILKILANFLTKASKDTSFSKIIKGTSVVLAVPSFYVSNILLFVYAIWGPQKIWMLWIDPLILIFVINLIVIVFIVKIVLLTNMFKNLVGTTKLKSTLASLLSILIPVDIVLVVLWIMGAELWN
ncbi:MAG: hypothetical protein ACTSQ2_13485, partial [Candidatus Heimdallarchaeaceae archaeon]